MKYENTHYKRRKLYQKSEQNKYDLENLENTEDKKKFSDNLINVIKTLYDSDYEQKEATLIANLWDVYYSVVDESQYMDLQLEEVKFYNEWGIEYSG